MSSNPGPELVLERVADAAARTWPEIEMPPNVFTAFLRTREESSSRRASSLHTRDLYLACACIERIPAAWRAFDKIHLARVPQLIATIERSPAFADEVRQRLAEKLLGDGGKLALYSGKGPLAAWIRVAAIREAQNTLRLVKCDAPGAHVDRTPFDGADPEKQLDDQRQAEAFRRAFEKVVETLALDRRNVLRLHYLDGLTLSEVARVYAVSRATASRWIAEAREALLERVGSELSRELGHHIEPTSVFALLESRLELSVQRHFC
jgi:RNA polymerase sigma-70 factor (ECF subfamily)